ncbi:hypothetical protein HWV62_31601 [Athelia sp. TMB]|nr:hypothetical protein HWV62_31601 [Athelia sp. TMB]
MERYNIRVNLAYDDEWGANTGMSAPSHDTLAANWDPEILQEYMNGVQKDREAGLDKEEELSDSFGEDSVDSSCSESSAVSGISFINGGQASDIASDDSAFSSDDEFADEQVREKQSVRRELVLGRADALATRSHRELVEMRAAYVKQIEDAEIELAEVTGQSREVVAQHKNTDEMQVDIHNGDVSTDKILKELRQRSRKQVMEADRRQLAEEVVLLAQALFRKEKIIKRMAVLDVDDA